MKSKKRRIPAAWRHALQMWSRICPEKCSDIQKTVQLASSFVSCAIPGPHSHRDSLEIIARTAGLPFSIESLSEALAAPILPRGATHFTSLGRVLDQIASNYPDMFWWMSDGGLNMAFVNFNQILPNRFDELAGTLMIQHWKDGKVSKESLLEIATELDKNRFLPKKTLQPKEWALIAEHNQKFSRAAITTFLRAAKHKRFSHLVRRSLYRARHRKTTAKSIQSSEFSFGVFA
jgi:hypothetical protein